MPATSVSIESEIICLIDSSGGSRNRVSGVWTLSPPQADLGEFVESCVHNLEFHVQVQ